MRQKGSRYRGRITGKPEKPHSYVTFQHRMLQHPAFLSLSGRACKALLLLAAQYKGNNNGDLALAWMPDRDAHGKPIERKRTKGERVRLVKGNQQLAIQELIERGFVLLTRQGGRNQCSLYALAWFPIDDCSGKLDVPATTVAPNDWLRIPIDPRVGQRPAVESPIGGSTYTTGGSTKPKTLRGEA